MPWKVKKTSSGWCVVSQDTGKVVPGGCHQDPQKARAHMRAIYANYRKGRGK